MRILQDLVEEFLQDLPEQTLAAPIEKKLAAQGVEISARQRMLLTSKIMEGDTDTLRLRNWKWWDTRHVTLEFTEKDVELIGQNFREFADKRLPDVLESATRDPATKILADLKRRWRAYSREQRRELGAFRKRLHVRWKLPLEALRMLVTMSRDSARA